MGKLAGLKKALDMSTAARMKRAKDQGFIVDAYHGTMRHANDMDGIDEFKLDAYGDRLGVHVGTKRAANDRIDHMVGPSDRDWDMAAERGEAPYIMPLKVKAQKPLRLPDLGYWEPNKVASELERKGVSLPEPKTFQGSPYYTNDQLRQGIKDAGYDSIIYRNNVEGVGSDSYIILDPANVRSTNAEFDTEKIGSPNLLASAAPAAVTAGLVGASMAPEEAQAAIAQQEQNQERRRRGEAFAMKREARKQQFAEVMQQLGNVLDLFDVPMQGLSGLARLGYGLAIGEDDALEQAARVTQQPIEDTAYQAGDYVLDKTGSPAAATAVNVLTQFAGPI